MKLPRSLSGRELAKALRSLGYQATRPPEHHITIPDHSPVKIGTLAAILADVADQQKMSREKLVKRLFG